MIFFHLDACLSTKQLWMADKDNGMHLFYYPRFVQTDNQSIVLSQPSKQRFFVDSFHVTDLYLHPLKLLQNR